MYCIYCGKNINDNSKFCCYCGLEQKLKSVPFSNPNYALIGNRKIINDNAYYKKVSDMILELYRTNGFKVVLNDMKIKKYYAEYSFKFSDILDKDISSVSELIYNKFFDISGITIKCSDSVKNLVTIRFPLKIEYY